MDWPEALPEGTTIGSQRLGRVIGRGGFTVVYRARDERIDVERVVKEFFPSEIARRSGTRVVAMPGAEGEFARQLEDFEGEARTLARLRHPGLVQFSGFLRENGTGYIILEHVAGPTLEAWLRDNPDPSEDDLRSIFVPLFGAVSACHAMGIVHGAIVPENVVLRDGHGPVLIDFGVHRDSSRTMAGVANPSYAPLEQVAGQPVSAATDVFYLAGCLYRAIVGRPPFKWRGTQQSNDATSWRPLPDHSIIESRIGSKDVLDRQPSGRCIDEAAGLWLDSEDFLRGIDQGLSERPADRPANVTDLKAALGWGDGRSAFRASPKVALGNDEHWGDLIALRRANRSAIVVGVDPGRTASYEGLMTAAPGTPENLGSLRSTYQGASPSAPAPVSPPSGARMPNQAPGASAGRTAAMIGAGLTILAAAFYWRDPLASALGFLLKTVGLTSGSAGAVAWGAPGNKDVVEVSVFGPVGGSPGDEILLQVFLHRLEEVGCVAGSALSIDPEASARGTTTLGVELAPDDIVTCVVEAQGLEGATMSGTLRWRRRAAALQFPLRISAAFEGKRILPRIHVLLGQAPIGTLTFALPVTRVSPTAVGMPALGTTGTASSPAAHSAGMIATSARRHRRAFISYAAPDRVEVLKRAQGLRAAGIEIFQDVLSLEPGERWERRLYEEIDGSDLFVLFWSNAARSSEWVLRELDYARRRRVDGDTPTIVPVVLEGPPPPAPPEGMTDIHFDDPLCQALAAWSRRQ